MNRRDEAGALPECADRAIAVLNIDCAIVRPFPEKGSGPYELVEQRARRLVALLRRVSRFPAAQ